jgi:Flp pilus assembly protein TadD
MKLGQTQEAVDDLQKATELNSDEDSLFYLISKGLHSLGREEEAKKAMQRVAELHAQTLAVQKKALVDQHIVGTQ